MKDTHTCCHGFCSSQCIDLAQLAPTSKGLGISYNVQWFNLQWLTLSTLLIMGPEAETAVQGWSVDPMEDITFLTHAQTHKQTSATRIFLPGTSVARFLIRTKSFSAKA